jgi:hypothetical protein
MNNNRSYTRIGFVAISLLLIASLIAVAWPQGQVQAATDPGTMRTWVQNGKIYLQTSAFTNNRPYKVKVRDGTQSTGGGWKTLGTAKIKKNTTQQFIYPIPKALAKTVYIKVCLKDQFTNKLFCKIAINPGY